MKIKDVLAYALETAIEDREAFVLANHSKGPDAEEALRMIGRFKKVRDRLEITPLRRIYNILAENPDVEYLTIPEIKKRLMDGSMKEERL